MTRPLADIQIDEALVGRLVAAQVPDLADQSIRIVASGWDNTIARIGQTWVARLPRHEGAAALIVHEQRWLPILARDLPLPVPVPTHFGLPTDEFPRPWSIGRWLPGSRASERPPTDERLAADALARFLTALHRPAPVDAPVSPLRGVGLEQLTSAVDQRSALLAGSIDPARVLDFWHDGLRSPAWSRPAVWLHGDLHPANILTFEGRLSAVLDFGDLTSGDPATDLAIAWMTFAADVREHFRRAVGVDAATWRRAASWALHFALAYCSSEEATGMPPIGRRALRAVLDEPV